MKELHDLAVCYILLCQNAHNSSVLTIGSISMQYMWKSDKDIAKKVSIQPKIKL